MCFTVYTKNASFYLSFLFQPPPREDWNGEIKGYYVGYRQNSAKLPFTYNTVEAEDDVVYYVLRGLKRGTRYLVTVRSFNDVGSGPSTEDIPLKTLDQGKKNSSRERTRILLESNQALG